MDARTRVDTQVVGALPLVGGMLQQWGLAGIVDRSVPWEGGVSLGMDPAGTEGGDQSEREDRTDPARAGSSEKCHRGGTPYRREGQCILPVGASDGNTGF